MRECDNICAAYLRQLQVLVQHARGDRQALLEAFLAAGMNCPGFSERQKAQFLSIVGRGPAAPWPFQTLSRPPVRTSGTDLGYWLFLFHQGVAVSLREAPADTPLGVLPYLRLEWDPQTSPIITATTEGFQLTRREFAWLERHFVDTLLSKGWTEWLSQGKRPRASVSKTPSLTPSSAAPGPFPDPVRAPVSTEWRVGHAPRRVGFHSSHLASSRGHPEEDSNFQGHSRRK